MKKDPSFLVLYIVGSPVIGFYVDFRYFHGILQLLSLVKQNIS